MFVASQVVRTLANKTSMERQLGRALCANEFPTEMAKQMKAIVSHWETDAQSFDFFTSCPDVKERFITGDSPVLVVQVKDRQMSVDPYGRRAASDHAIEGITRGLPMPCSGSHFSPYVHVCLWRMHGGGEAH